MASRPLGAHRPLKATLPARGRCASAAAAAAAPPPARPLADLVGEALSRRTHLVRRLEAEGTEAYRLFHGASEGRPGLTVDRYGAVVLVQSFRHLLGAEDLEALRDLFPGTLHYNPRGRHARPFWEAGGEGQGGGQAAGGAGATFTELGASYRFGFKEGGDPSLYLDFRPARRWLAEHAGGRAVLNTFAYTCGAGVAAARGGAARVVNTDHGGGCLATGRDNAALNGVEMEFLQADYYPTLRQVAGLPVKGRPSARGKGYARVPRQEFDIVVLDPPTLTKTRWGSVDIERDYAALAKPALLALREGGGALLATNHSARVSMEEWVDVVERCGRKAGRPVRSVEPLEVEEDFPSFDGRPPLKMAVFEA